MGNASPCVRSLGSPSVSVAARFRRRERRERAAREVSSFVFTCPDRCHLLLQILAEHLPLHMDLELKGGCAVTLHAEAFLRSHSGLRPYLLQNDMLRISDLDIEVRGCTLYEFVAYLDKLSFFLEGLLTCDILDFFAGYLGKSTISVASRSRHYGGGGNFFGHETPCHVLATVHGNTLQDFSGNDFTLGRLGFGVANKSSGYFTSLPFVDLVYMHDQVNGWTQGMIAQASLHCRTISELCLDNIRMVFTETQYRPYATEHRQVDKVNKRLRRIHGLLVLLHAGNSSLSVFSGKLTNAMAALVTAELDEETTPRGKLKYLVDATDRLHRIAVFASLTEVLKCPVVRSYVASIEDVVKNAPLRYSKLWTKYKHFLEVLWECVVSFEVAVTQLASTM